MQTESKEKSVYNPICPVKAQSKYKSKRKNQKANPCKDSVKNRILRERFFDSSSVAAGSQSAMQQIELRGKNVEKKFGDRRESQ